MIRLTLTRDDETHWTAELPDDSDLITVTGPGTPEQRHGETLIVGETLLRHIYEVVNQLPAGPYTDVKVEAGL